MVVKNEYYVIGMREKGTDAMYYYKEKSDAGYVFVKDASRAMITKTFSLANEIVGEVLFYITYNIFQGHPECNVCCLDDGTRLNLFSDEVDFANAVSIKRVSVTYEIVNVDRR